VILNEAAFAAAITVLRLSKKSGVCGKRYVNLRRTLLRFETTLSEDLVFAKSNSKPRFETQSITKLGYWSWSEKWSAGSSLAFLRSK
jgi:hypothetical protein